MNRLTLARKSGNEAEIQQAVKDFNTHIEPYKKKLSSPPPSLGNASIVSHAVNYVETIATDYFEVIKFVLKKMHINKFNEIRFALNEDFGVDVSIIKKGEEYSLDFDAYVHHDDERETEYLMEIEALFADNPDLDCNKVIYLLKNKDWSQYCS